MISRIAFPWFTFMLKDFSGAVFLSDGDNYFMPIFTHREAAELYQRLLPDEVKLVELPIVSTALAYLDNPPSRATSHDNLQFRIAIDPVSPDATDFYVYERDVLISALRAQLGK